MKINLDRDNRIESLRLASGSNDANPIDVAIRAEMYYNFLQGTDFSKVIKKNAK